jgi:hypothetical protein
MMAEINLAYETLRDSQRRQEYDTKNGITVEEKEDAAMYNVEEEEIGQQEPSPAGRCAKCNFINSPGCSSARSAGMHLTRRARIEGQRIYVTMTLPPRILNKCRTTCLKSYVAPSATRSTYTAAARVGNAGSSLKWKKNLRRCAC